MNLGKQIDSLLKRHPSVYVDGLGVFRRIRTSATFDSKRNVFLPPISYIEFDQHSSEGYDFLIYLQQLEQLSPAEATIRLNSIVTEIFGKIHQNSEYLLEGLGSLVGYGASYVFKPLDLSGFLFSEVGVDDYQESPSIESDLQSAKIEISTSEVISDQQNQELEKSIDANVNADLNVETKNIEDVETNIPEESKESNSYIYGLVAVIAILILGGIYYYATKKPSNRTLVENKVTLDIPNTVDSNSLDVDTIGHVDSINTSYSDQDSTIETILVDPVKPEIIIDDKYAIVIGTHKTLAQAQDEAASYNKKGHKTVRVLQPNLSKNLKRVIWDTYPTREKRDSALREVRKRYKGDAWGTEI